MGRARLAVLAIALLIAAYPARAQETSCALSGTVVSRSMQAGALVDGASVSMPRIGKSVLSDSVGGFRLGAIPCGRHEVQIRKIGFTVWLDTVDLTQGQELKRLYTLVSVAQLDTVRTKGDEIQYQSPRLQDFESRRKRNVGGYFIGEADLRRVEHISIESTLRSRVPGLQFTYYRNIVAARGRSSNSTGINGSGGDPRINPDDGRSPRGCWIIVYLDGSLIFDGVPKSGALPPDFNQIMAMNLSGIEYYPRAGGMPLQFKTTTTNCGTLLLWTRGR